MFPVSLVTFDPQTNNFGTPYSRLAGFDTNIGAFIESSFVLSTEGSMARLVINEDITSGGALTPGQVLQLGGFTMGARSAVKPMVIPTITKHHLHASLEHSEKMDPANVSSLIELLDRIAALVVAIDYDRIGIKPNQREIKSPLVTHMVADLEE